MKRWIIAGLVVGLLLSLTACADGDGATDASVSERTVLTTVNVLDISISELISQEQLEQMTGQTLRTPEVKENGTQLYALSTDGMFSLKINMAKQDRSRFDQMTAGFPDCVGAPNLGDAAVYVPLYKTLFAYGKGYAIDVGMSGETFGEEDALLLARQVVALLLEKL